MFNHIHSLCVLSVFVCFAASLPLIEKVNEAPKAEIITPKPEIIAPKTEIITPKIEPAKSETKPEEPVKIEAIPDIKIAAVLPEIENKYIIDNSTSNGAKDLYVIRTVVYEVGILTDATNSTLNDTQTHEQVDLTFFDPKHNGSLIDLSNIPVPIQTNISGVSVTGIAPANLGSIQLAEGDEPATLLPNFPLQVPILPNALITVRHNISTTNSDKEAELLSNLPNLLGLTSPITGETLKIESGAETKIEAATEGVSSSKVKVADAAEEKNTKEVDDTSSEGSVTIVKSTKEA